MADVLHAIGYMFGLWKDKKVGFRPLPPEKPKLSRNRDDKFSAIDRETFPQPFGFNVVQVWAEIENVYHDKNALFRKFQEMKNNRIINLVNEIAYKPPDQAHYFQLFQRPGFQSKWIPNDQYQLNSREMTWEEFVGRSAKLFRMGKFKAKPNHKAEKRSLQYNRGWTLPYYNYCGPGNSLNKGLPTSIVDSLCMMHDLDYSYKGTTEKVDDTIFIRRLRDWGSANAGDGFTGPTQIEKQFIIPLIATAFSMKLYKKDTGEGMDDGPWDTMLDYFGNIIGKFKDQHLFGSQKPTEQIQLSVTSPLQSFKNLITAAWEKAKADGNDAHLSSVILDGPDNKNEDAIQYAKYWGADKVASILKGDNGGETAYDAVQVQKAAMNEQTWIKSQLKPGMMIPQYLGQLETSIINYVGTNENGDLMIYPIMYHVKEGEEWKDLYGLSESWGSEQNRIKPNQGEERYEKKPYYIWLNEDTQEAIRNSDQEHVRSLDVRPYHVEWFSIDDPGFLYESEKKQIINEGGEVIITRETATRDRNLNEHLDRINFDTHIHKKQKVEGGAVVQTLDEDDEYVLPHKPPHQSEVEPGSEQTNTDMAAETAEQKKARELDEKRREGGGYNVPANAATTGWRTTSAGNDIEGITGETSCNLGPPRNLIQLKTIFINSDVIVRNWILFSHNGGIDAFFGNTTTLTSKTAGTDTTQPYAYFQRYGRRMAANMIPLDMGALCLDGKSQAYIKSLAGATTRMKFHGGRLEMHGLRWLENMTTPTRALTQELDSGLKSADRKVMWKMYDRERDGHWQPDIVTSNLSSAINLDTTNKTVLSTLLANIEQRRRGGVNGVSQVKQAWTSRTFPSAVQLFNNTGQTNADRTYESLRDHPISSGHMEFPIMGWPKWVATQSVGFTHCQYITKSPQPIDVLNLTNISFVNMEVPTIEEVMRTHQGDRHMARTYDKTTNTWKSDSSAYLHGLQTKSIHHSYTDDQQSSMAAIIHVPAFPTADGSTEYTGVVCDLRISGCYELDMTRISDYDNPSDLINGVHGHTWKDTVDPWYSPWDGFTLSDTVDNRMQWACPDMYMYRKSLAKNITKNQNVGIGWDYLTSCQFTADKEMKQKVSVDYTDDM